MTKARAASNPSLSMHRSFVDMGGHGYVAVSASSTVFEAEFVCIPRPLERAPAMTAARSPIAYGIAPGRGEVARPTARTRDRRRRSALLDLSFGRRLAYLPTAAMPRSS